MSRTEITAEELYKWMTAELRKVEGCEGCSVEGVLRLQQPDADGCNWSDSITVRSGGVPVEDFRADATRIAAKARQLFNLK